MARTESFSIQVHPNDEQSQINLMQKFHWNLLNTQEIKVKDSHLEQRGDSIYSVTTSEHYVKLAFTRELDLPNLDEVRKLENEYFSLENPKFPKLFPVSFWIFLILAFVYGTGVVIWLIYFFAYYQPKKKEADEINERKINRQNEIMNELRKFD
ncbi:MAG: hypothetical protein HOO91_09240 [Bacteroidales bacterium]|nr:hypothetical protein [Bacteroidales bacterium]